jgi:hypothetical protein
VFSKSADFAVLAAANAADTLLTSTDDAEFSIGVAATFEGVVGVAAAALGVQFVPVLIFVATMAACISASAFI